MSNSELSPEDKVQSNVINFLRFPLIIAVLFIHNYNPSVVGNNELHIYNGVSEFFSQVLGRVAVPFFFLISGFLFFFKVEHFDSSIFAKKINSRLHSLILPYLFWNLLLLIIQTATFWLLGNTVGRSGFSMLGILKSLWNSNSGYPISYQFWFIRDLIITVLISPVLYFLIKKLNLTVLIVLFALWFFNKATSNPGINTTSLFFFSMGAWFSVNGKRLTSCVITESYFVLCSYPFLIFVDLLTIGTSVNIYIHNMGIIVGIWFWLMVVYRIVYKYRIKPNGFLTKVSFFLFAFHEPLLSILKRRTFSYFEPSNDLAFTFFYFTNVMLVSLIGMILYVGLSRVAPKFLKIISGGR